MGGRGREGVDMGVVPARARQSRSRVSQPCFLSPSLAPCQVRLYPVSQDSRGLVIIHKLVSGEESRGGWAERQRATAGERGKEAVEETVIGRGFDASHTRILGSTDMRPGRMATSTQRGGTPARGTTTGEAAMLGGGGSGMVVKQLCRDSRGAMAEVDLWRGGHAGHVPPGGARWGWKGIDPAEDLDKAEFEALKRRWV